MAWSFTDLPYGWRYVVGISLAATTIYVATNTRWRVNQADEIELDLAVAERCMATQYGTNALGEPLYRVDPPSIVRSWYSNSYVTTNVPGDPVTNWTAQLHTNIYTNVIGWRTDRAMMVELDAKIKALIPYYVDTNTVYDGTTNIIMLTVTGLWASLGIGDGTNQFTATPCWTNNVGETNCTTNAATYGPWGWRNYIIAWQERYKVLNALKIFRMPRSSINASYEGYYGEGSSTSSWAEAKSITATNFSRITAVTNAYLGLTAFYCYHQSIKYASYWKVETVSTYLQTFFMPGSTNFNHRDSVFIAIAATNELAPVYTFDDNGLPASVGVYSLIYTQPAWNNDATVELPVLFGLQSMPNESDDPGPVTNASALRGFVSVFANYDAVWVNREFQFNYATNKYW